MRHGLLTHEVSTGCVKTGALQSETPSLGRTVLLRDVLDTREAEQSHTRHTREHTYILRTHRSQHISKREDQLLEKSPLPEFPQTAI